MTNYPLSPMNVHIQILLTDLHTFSSKKSIVEGIVKRTESNVALARRNIATKLYFMLFDQSLQKSSWL